MSTLAKITATILIIVGILVMLGGIGLGITGSLTSGVRGLGLGLGRVPVRAPLGGIIVSIIVGLLIFIQGLTITATGEGLFLLVNVARNTKTTA